jgi:hypothetical protein
MTKPVPDETQPASTAQLPDDLWQDFPKTATDFEARFATEQDCRAYWSKARWGDTPACAKCHGTRVWPIRKGTWFECAACHHQTSLTSGTLLDRTRKPLKVWFRAVFEISVHRTGISAKDLQRIMGFGSYETAWTWLHKLRSAMVRSDSEPLGPLVQVDEALVGGKGGPNKELVLVAAEANGRVRLAHADNNDAATLKTFADGQIAQDATVTSDGHAGYSAKSLDKRPHEAIVQTKAEKREADAVQSCHWSPPTPGPSHQSTCRPTSTSTRSATTGAGPRVSAASPPASSSSWSSTHR